MPTPGFSLTAIPPNVLLALGKAFATPTDPNAPHYDEAMFHLLTHMTGEVTETETGLPHLALAMKSLALLMGGTSLTPVKEEAPKELAPPPPPTPILTAMVNSPNTPEDHRESAERLSNGLQELIKAEEEEPKSPLSFRTLTARADLKSPEGLTIIPLAEAGQYLGTNQMLSLLGMRRNTFHTLMEKGAIKPTGVIERNGLYGKVWSPEDAEAIRQRNLNRKTQPPISAEHKKKLDAGRDRINALPMIDPARVEDGTYWTWDTVVGMTGASRGYLGKLAAEGHFPNPDARVQIPGIVAPLVAFKSEDVWKWINGNDSLAFRRRREQQAIANAMANGRRAIEQSPDDQHERPQEAPLPPVEEAKEHAAKIKEPPAPKGWLSLREVAQYLDLSETSVERMVKEGQFMKPHRLNPRGKLKEWGARQVVKWKRDHIRVKALVS